MLTLLYVFIRKSLLKGVDLLQEKNLVTKTENIRWLLGHLKKNKKRGQKRGQKRYIDNK